MEIELPAIPVGVLTLLSFIAPYAIALINHPAWPAGSKRVIAIAVSIALGLVVLWLYYVITGDTIPQWPLLILVAIAVAQAAYTLLWSSVKGVEGRHGTAKDTH